MQWLPNLFTLANLVSGCTIIVAVFESRTELALWAMLACLIFDFLDGMVARALKIFHPLGAQLDSLADVISFGVAPGIVGYHLLDGLQANGSWAWLAFLFPAMAAIRLARFNVEEGEDNFFVGLPSPAAAVFMFGLYLLDTQSDCDACNALFLNLPVILGSTTVLSFLMVSNLPHFNLKVKHLRWQGNEMRWIFVALSVLLLFLLREAALSSIVVLYILLSLIAQSFKRISP